MSEDEEKTRRENEELRRRCSPYYSAEDDLVLARARRQADLSADRFSDDVEKFVRRFAPRDLVGGHAFRHELMLLFTTAMRSQSDIFAFSVTESTVARLREASLRPLHTIFKNEGK